MKKFKISPLFPCRESWDSNEKEECNNIIKNWHMTFQALDLKSNHFLNLLNNELCIIKPSYFKESLWIWIKHFSHSNLLYIRATRAIINHILIGKYYLRFFLRKDFSCLCKVYSIKTRCHILYNYRRYNKY